MVLDLIPIRRLRSALSNAVGRNRPSFPLEEAAYRRLSNQGFSPRCIIDVGAYEGNWTRLARRVFTDVPVIMVEPQASKKVHLNRVANELPKTTYVQALLTSQSGQENTFFEMETGSSIFPENSNVARKATHLVSQTLDEIAVGIGSPIMLKIDVQGAELEVLKGGESTLRECEVVQLEVAVASYNSGAPTILEVLEFMDARGFRPFDISGETRHGGGSLVQIDLLFAPDGSPFLKSFFEFPGPAENRDAH